MAITFPSSPSNGQVFSTGTRSWVWDGTQWRVTATSVLISGTQLFDDSVDTEQLADDAVTADKIAPNTVIEPSIVNAKGDILVGLIHDTVDVLPLGTNGRFLKANSSTQTGLEWSEIPTINNLSDVGDVSITSVSSGQFLKWNGTAWVNDAIDLGTDTNGNYVSDITAGTGITVTHTASEGSSPTVAVTANTYDAFGAASSAQSAAQSYADSLSVNYDPAGSASSAQTAAQSYADSLAVNYDPAGSAQSAQTAAEAYADSLAVNYDPAGSASAAQLAAESYADSLAVNYDPAGSASSAQTAAETYADTQIGNLDTDDIAEGVTNKYFTDQRALDALPQNIATTDNVIFNTVETTGNLTVGGDLIVDGTLTTVNETNLAIEDTFVYLNDGSTTANPDLGWAGNYNDGSYKHAGLFRDATDGKFKFFDSYTPEPSDPINTGHASYSAAPVVAETFESTVTTGTAPFTVASTTEVENLHADTATTLHTSRTIELSGDVTGSVSFDGSQNVNISTSISANSVALGVDTSGNYMSDVTAGTGISVSHTQGEGSSAQVSLNASIDDLSNVNAPSPSADQYLKWNGTEWVPKTITLGSETSGNYVADVTAGTGITVTHTPGEGSSASVALNASIDNLSDVTISSASSTQILRYNGSAWVNSDQTTIASTSVTANTATAVDSFSKTAYRSAEYLVQVTQGSKYTTLKALVMHDGTSVYFTQYGILEAGSPAIPLTLTTAIVSNDVVLSATISDASTTNATVKLTKTLLPV